MTSTVHICENVCVRIICDDLSGQQQNKRISTHWVEHATVEELLFFVQLHSSETAACFHPVVECVHMSFCFCWMNYIRISHETMKCRINFGMSNRWTQPCELVLFCPPHLRSYPKKSEIRSYTTSQHFSHPLKTWIDETLMKILPYLKGHASSCFVSYICSVSRIPNGCIWI